MRCNGAMSIKHLYQGVDLLACGHPDDDEDVWHHSDDHPGEPVCSACCDDCHPREGAT